MLIGVKDRLEIGRMTLLNLNALYSWKELIIRRTPVTSFVGVKVEDIKWNTFSIVVG